MATRTVYGGPERYAFVPDDAQRLVDDISDRTADFFAREIGFEQLAMPDDTGEQFVLNPNVIRAYHELVMPVAPHIQRAKRAIDTHPNNKPGAGQHWSRDMEDRTLAEGIRATIQRDVAQQSFTRELVQQARMLPVGDGLMDRLHHSWLDNLVARKKSSAARPDVTERVAIVYANLCIETPTIDPDTRTLRTVSDPSGASRVVPVRRVLARNIDKLALDVRKGRQPDLTLGDVEELGRLAYEDYELPWVRQGRPVVDTANGGSALRTAGRRAGGAAIFGVAASAVVAPHAAAAPASPSAATQVSASQLHVAATEASATSPSSLPGSKPGLIINVPSRQTAATRLHTAPTTPSQPSVISTVESPAVQVVQKEAQVAHELTTPVAEVVQATIAPQEVKPTVAIPVPEEPRKEHSVLAEAAADGEITQQERVAAAVATLGLGANIDTAQPGQASEADSAKPQPTPLFEGNLLLSDFIEEKATQIATDRKNGRTSDFIDTSTANTALLQVQALLGDKDYLKNLTDDEKKAIKAPGDGMEASIVNQRANELMAEMQKPENSNGKVLKENELKQLAIQLAIAELSVAPDSEKDRLQSAVEKAAREAAVAAAVEKAREAAAARKAADSKIRIDTEKVNKYLAGETHGLSKTQLKFIQRVTRAAMDAKAKGAKISVPVVVAQSVHESGWGESGLAQQANNLFGIKVGSSGWTGKSLSMDTGEVYDGKAVTVSANWRVYDSIEDSVRDYVRVISTQDHFADAQACSGRPGEYIDGLIAKLDPKTCNILIPQGQDGAMSYATDPDYKGKLLRTIDSLGLDKFNKIANFIEKPKEAPATKKIKDAVAYAKELSWRDGRRTLTPDPDYKGLPDCGFFTGTVIRKTMDHDFPQSGTFIQEPYVEKSKKWKRIQNTGSTSNLEPGDLFIVNQGSGAGGAGHTFMYIGGGKVAVASLNTYMPRIGGVYFADNRGPYTIWRYVG